MPVKLVPFYEVEHFANCLIFVFPFCKMPGCVFCSFCALYFFLLIFLTKPFLVIYVARNISNSVACLFTFSIVSFNNCINTFLLTNNFKKSFESNTFLYFLLKVLIHCLSLCLLSGWNEFLLMV